MHILVLSLKALEAANQKLEGQVAALSSAVNNLVNLGNGEKKDFPDVPGTHWASDAVDSLHGNDIVNGYPDGNFKGDKPMTRYEYAEMLYNALKRGQKVSAEIIKEYTPELQKVQRNAFYGNPDALSGSDLTQAIIAADKAGLLVHPDK